MRNLKLIIEFDGTNYHGWQIQKEENTVQQILRDALCRILNRPVTLHGSGRTDSGVHALGQVANFLTDAAMDVARLRLAVNSIIPKDIAVKHAEEVGLTFHSRYSAKSRTYWYLIWNTRVRSAFYERYSWHIIQPLDIAAMREAARYLIGTHDFSSFQGADKENGHAVRDVKSFYFRETGQNLIICSITANAFVKHMVRNIIGTLADVGKGKMSIGEFKTVFEKRDRTLAGITAPAQGLFLKEVHY
jgi:tRNA pseudouridine38-40 synthase